MAKSLRSNKKKALRTIKRQKVVGEKLYSEIENKTQDALARAMAAPPVPVLKARKDCWFAPGDGACLDSLRFVHTEVCLNCCLHPQKEDGDDRGREGASTRGVDIKKMRRQQRKLAIADLAKKQPTGTRRLATAGAAASNTYAGTNTLDASSARLIPTNQPETGGAEAAEEGMDVDTSTALHRVKKGSMKHKQRPISKLALITKANMKKKGKY